MKVYAPGKLILSGEHAVVYGEPALAMAVDRYAIATITHTSLPQVLLDLSDLAYRRYLSAQALDHLKARIKRKYHRFIRGEYRIRQVLQKPFELAQFALSMMADALNLSLPSGMKIQVQSTIPMGCGMGSSAATILSVMVAVSHYFQLGLNEESLFQLALQAENMQHGHSSGLDLRVALQGGCCYVHGANLTPRPLPTDTLYVVNTGKPQSHTGECVETVAPHFQTASLRADFAAVTQAMNAALQQQTTSEPFYSAVRANHRLLVQIGVVPSTVQEFISQIEAQGGAAKVCGAGAVRGEQAGAVLVVGEDKQTITQLCQRFAYPLIAIAGETRGVYSA